MGTVFLRGDGRGVQKLKVQLGQPIPAASVHVGDIQSVPVFSAAIQVFAPAQTVLLHPAPALAHAFRQDHLYPVNRMPNTLNIHDLRHAELLEKNMEIHLVYYTLDIRHTDLEGMVVVVFTAVRIKLIAQLCGDQALAVKLQHLDIRQLLHAGIAAHRFLRSVVLDRDDGDVLHDAPGIVHHDDVIGVHMERVLVDLSAAGEHQAVVGIELGKLAVSDLHPQRHPFPKRVIQIRTDEGEPVVPAHAGRALKSAKGHRAAPEDKLDPLRAKQPLRQFLQFLRLACRLAVKDAGKVQIDEEAQQLVLLRKRRFAGHVRQRQKLMEHGAVVLHGLPDRRLIRLVIDVEIEVIAVLRLPRTVQDRARGDLINAVLLHFHELSLPSRLYFITK